MRKILWLGPLLIAFAPRAGAAADVPCFYDKEAFTIESKLSGAESGTLVEHVKDCGRTRVEVKDAVVEFAGIKNRTRTRTVFEGPDVISVNLDTGAVTKSRNPMYEKVVASMKGKAGVEVGKDMMRGMGGKQTGEKGTFAGEACEYWEVASLGAKVCVTSWGGTLSTKATIMGITSQRVATAVRLGDAGPAEAYKYDTAKLQAGPDIGEIMRRMRAGQPPK